MQRVRRESGGGADNAHAARDAGLEAEMPLLAGHITERLFDDGQERETSTLLIFAGDGSFKACLNNRSEGLALWVTADTLGGTLEALERALDSSSPDWRPMRVQKRK